MAIQRRRSGVSCSVLWRRTNQRRLRDQTCGPRVCSNSERNSDSPSPRRQLASASLKASGRPTSRATASRPGPSRTSSNFSKKARFSETSLAPPRRISVRYYLTEIGSCGEFAVRIPLLLREEIAETLEAFLSQVDRSGECWLWTGNKCRFGYGVFWPGKLNEVLRSGVGAHRVAWALFNGPIPPKRTICHECDTPACVRPDHLYCGTHASNRQDWVRRGVRRTWGGKPGSRVVVRMRVWKDGQLVDVELPADCKHYDE